MRFVPALNAVANHLSTFALVCTRHNPPHVKEVEGDTVLFRRESMLLVRGYQTLHKECEDFEVKLWQFTREKNNNFDNIEVDEIAERIAKTAQNFQRFDSLERAVEYAGLSKKCLLLLREYNSLLLSKARYEVTSANTAIEPTVCHAASTNSADGFVYFFTKSERAIVVARFKL